MTHILGIDEYVTEKLKIKPITKKMLRDTTSYKNKIDFIKAKGIVNGMDFEKVKNLPNNDNRFYFGAEDGSNNEVVDLGFGSVLITATNIDGKAVVSDNYECYDD